MDAIDARSLPLLAGLAARSFGCRLVQDPNCSTASVGKDRVIRITPFKDLASQDEVDLVVGKVVHEVIHIAYSDWLALEQATLSPFANNLRNVFEDVWGERRQAREYPGAPGKISKAFEVMQKRGLFGMPEEGLPPQALLFGTLLCGLRTQELGQTMLQASYEAYRAQLESTIGAEPTRKLWEAALAVRDCESTTDAINLAHKIEAMLKEEAEQPESPDSENPGNEEAQDGDGQPDSNGDAGEESVGESGGNPAAEGDPAPAEGQGSPQAGNGSPSPGTGEPLPITRAQAQAIRDALDAQDGFGPTDLGDMIGDEMDDSGITVSYGQGAGDVLDPNPGKLMPQPERAALIRQRATPVATQLGIRLEALLETLIDSQVYADRSGRKLMRSSLSGIPIGNTRIFRRQEENAGVDTAISMVIDISGSMSSELTDGKPAIEATEETAWAMGDVLDKFDIPFAITAFGSRTSSIKHFDEDWRTASRKVWCSLESNTVTHHAIRTTAGELIMQDQERKLLLLVTDGIPSDATNTAVEIREAQRAGIEVAILFIAADEPDHFIATLTAANTGIRPTRINSGEGIAKSIFKAVEGAFD